MKKLLMALLIVVLFLCTAYAGGLRKEISYDFSVTEWGHIQVRQITRVMEGDKELSKSYHRHVLNPGDDVINEPEMIQDVARALWTPEVIQAYKDMIAEQEKKIE